MKQIIIINWWSCFITKEDFYKALQNRDYNPFKRGKNWNNWLIEQLKETHQTMIPEMPNKFNADYIAWKIWFERHFPFLNNEDVILIGRSFGGIFLAKYLSENVFPKKIKQLHFISATFENNKHEDIWNFRFNPNQLQNLVSQVDKIFIYHSKDDKEVPYSHSEKYKEYLPSANFIAFENRGHFREETFPELLENITLN